MTEPNTKRKGILTKDKDNVNKKKVINKYVNKRCKHEMYITSTKTGKSVCVECNKEVKTEYAKSLKRFIEDD